MARILNVNGGWTLKMRILRWRATIFQPNGTVTKLLPGWIRLFRCIHKVEFRQLKERLHRLTWPRSQWWFEQRENHKLSKRIFVKTKLGSAAFLIFATISAVHGQQADSASRWATIAAYEFEVSPNIVYGVAEGHELKLDVITAGPRSEVRPTLIYIHGGGWAGGAKNNMRGFLCRSPPGG